MKKILSTVLMFVLAMFPIISSAQQLGNSVPVPSRSGGYFYAAGYGRWVAHTTTNTAASATAIVLDQSYFVISPTEGRTFNPFGFSSTVFPQILVDSGSAQETDTPTGVSGCSFPQNLGTGQLGTCTVAGTYANAHGANAFVQSGTFGLQEAILDANASGGGVVVVDQNWSLIGGTTAMITSAATGALSTVKVWILDLRGPVPRWYGKSGSGTAVYSDTNNDMVFTVTLAAGTATKTLSQTYAAAPQCQATDTTAAAATKTAPTVSTVVLTGTTTDVLAVHCDY